MSALFEATAVRFRYGDVPALDGLSLSIAAGTRVALLGANGSGKSTLLRMLDGLAFPQEGSIRFEGEPLTEARMNDDGFALGFRRRVGFLFQSSDVQLFNPTVFDEIAFGPLQLGWDESRTRAGVAKAMDLLDIAGLEDRSPHRLSGGEKKRVALAAVLVIEPEVLLLDEPTAALDPRGQSAVIDVLSNWRGSARTVVTTTHDLGIVEDVADHCVILHEGRVAAMGPPNVLLEDEDLLRRTGLLHAHRHRHDGGVEHSHPHRHRGHRH